MQSRVTIPLGLAAVTLALLWSRSSDASAPVALPVLSVPAADTMDARIAADSAFSEVGAVFDSVVWGPDSLLHLHLKRGTFINTNGIPQTACEKGIDPYPATQHVAVQIYRQYARSRSHLRGVVVHIRTDSVIRSGVAGRETCSASSAAHYYRPTLDSLVTTGASAS